MCEEASACSCASETKLNRQANQNYVNPQTPQRYLYALIWKLRDSEQWWFPPLPSLRSLCLQRHTLHPCCTIFPSHQPYPMPFDQVPFNGLVTCTGVEYSGSRSLPLSPPRPSPRIELQIHSCHMHRCGMPRILKTRCWPW